MKRVAVTGIGMVSSLGAQISATWNSLCSSQLGPLSIPSQFGILNLPFIGVRSKQKTVSVKNSLLVAAVVQALDESGLQPTLQTETSVVQSNLFSIPDPSSDLRYQLIQSSGDSGAPSVRQLAQFTGPSISVTNGLSAVIQGYRLINRGQTKSALICGANPYIGPQISSQYKKFLMLSKKGVCRSFDNERDGIVLGQGGAALILEEMEQAQARKAKIYAQISGIGAAFRNTHRLLASSQNSHIEEAIKDGKPDLVIAHGAGTVKGDASQACVLNSLLAGVPVTCIKPVTGHLVAASGLAESALGALAIQQSIIPPVTSFRDTNLQLEIVRKLKKASISSVLVHSVNLDGRMYAVRYSKVG